MGVCETHVILTPGTGARGGLKLHFATQLPPDHLGFFLLHLGPLGTPLGPSGVPRGSLGGPLGIPRIPRVPRKRDLDWSSLPPFLAGS